MRIDPAGKPTGIGPASPAHSAPAASSAGASKDQVSISLLCRAAVGASVERLDQIQSSVRSGAYYVTPRELSHSIVEFYLVPVS